MPRIVDATAIADILPPAVCSAEAFDDPRGVELFPAEEAVVRDAVPARRREFATGRLCARRALARLGVPPAPLLPGARGAPRWPAGIVGSITHCRGYRAAAVARAARFAAVGIDAEPHEPLPADVLAAVALPAEARQVDALLAARPGVAWDRLLFSTKEAVYKVWFPLTRLSLGFDGAAVAIDPDRGTFAARLRAAERAGPGAPRRLLGRWRVTAGLVVTTAVVPGDGQGTTDPDVLAAISCGFRGNLPHVR